LIQTNIISRLEAELGQLQASLARADHARLDVIQVVRLAFGDTNLDTGQQDDVSKLVSTIEGEISRLKDSVKQVEELIDRQTGMLNEHYTKLSQILNAHAVIKAALDFDYYLMTQKQTQVINKFTLAFQKLRNYVQAGLTNLYYRRTEGLIAAKKFKNKKAEIGGWATRTSKLISSISPRQQAIDDLPFYYRQLFLRPHSVTDDLWLVRDNDVRDAEESVAFYRRVRSGGLLVLGAPRSGKSYLSEFIAKNHFEADNCFYINPPDDGSIEIREFHRSVKKGLKYYGEIQSAFDQLPAESVLVFNDTEKWWERSEEGFRVLDNLIDMIEHYSGKALFIVNMSWHSFHLINAIGGIEESFFKIIRTQPFNAEELKQVVLSRHRTSRLKFRWQDKHEESLSEWKLAKLFTKFFDSSEGNVGVALQQWICSIESITANGEIEIRQPRLPDREVLSALGRDRVVLLIQFVLHKQLNLERLARIMKTDTEEVFKQIEVLQRLDVVHERNGVYEINRYLQPLVIETFEEDLLL
jgi:hypothetical protein